MREGRTTAAAGVALCVLAIGAMTSRLVRSDEPKHLDPAAWGSDHVGKPVPEYTTGDECLFCHRETGKTWGENRHNMTIRPLDLDSPAGLALKQPPAKDFAEAVKLVLGGHHRQRFLNRAKEYGKLDLLSIEWVPPQDGRLGKLASVERPHWHESRFADSCAGCHTTAVDPKEKA